MPSDSSLSQHPPKPRMTLRVGFTGHRPNKLAGAVARRIRTQLPEVFAAIERATSTILAKSAPLYADEPPAFRLVCGFAEGADQIAVATCPAGWRIEAILPFPRENYLLDFATSAAGDGRDVSEEFLQSLAKAAVVTELPAPSGAREQGYAEAGGFMLRQIDILVAVWDGKPPKAGGTGAVLREAAAGGIPVVWLSTENEAPPKLITRAPTMGDPQAAAFEWNDTALTAVLAPDLAAPERSTSPDSARAGLERYLGEHWKRRSWFTAYDALRRLARWQLPRVTLSLASRAQRGRDWNSFLASVPAAGLRERIGAVLAPRYAWADMLAVHYSQLYRSASVFCYFLSAVAVFIALGTVFIHEDPQTPALEVLSTKAVFVTCELSAIGTIILIVWLGLNRRWHERWLNYRALAEMLRHGRFLAYVGEFGRTQTNAPSDRDAPWMLWYMRATMREIGLPAALLDGRYRQALLTATYNEEIDGPHGQLAYNRHNIKRAQEVDLFLHRIGIGCFVLTSLILTIFLALFALDRMVATTSIETLVFAAKPFLTFLGAGLPALGAAVAGIRAHGGFEESAKRSARTLDQLAGLSDDYARNAKGDASLEDTAELLIATARILSEDIAAWQDLYGRKRLTLPA
jgi:hypothetical protein